MVAALLADEVLPVSWLPKMLTAHVTTFIAVCVMTFDRGSESFKVDGELSDEMLQGFYRLQQQYSVEAQTSSVVDRHLHELLTANDLVMSVFSVLPPQLPSDPRASTTKRHRYRSKKRSQHLDDEMDAVQPVCPSQSEWRALTTALDINNTAVRVYQPSRGHNNSQPATSGGHSRHRGSPLRQWFYTVTCRNDVMASRRHCPGCCLAIDNGRFSSSCEQKRSYVMAYVSRSEASARNHWAWIQVDTSCNCAVSRRRQI